MGNKLMAAAVGIAMLVAGCGVSSVTEPVADAPEAEPAGAVSEASSSAYGLLALNAADRLVIPTSAISLSSNDTSTSRLALVDRTGSLPNLTTFWQPTLLDANLDAEAHAQFNLTSIQPCTNLLGFSIRISAQTATSTYPIQLKIVGKLVGGGWQQLGATRNVFGAAQTIQVEFTGGDIDKNLEQVKVLLVDPTNDQSILTTADAQDLADTKIYNVEFYGRECSQVTASGTAPINSTKHWEFNIFAEEQYNPFNLSTIVDRGSLNLMVRANSRGRPLAKFLGPINDFKACMLTSTSPFGTVELRGRLNPASYREGEISVANWYFRLILDDRSTPPDRIVSFVISPSPTFSFGNLTLISNQGLSSGSIDVVSNNICP